MATALILRLSQTFQGVIWNTLVDQDSQRLFFEIREPLKKTVSFAALNLLNNQWLWKDFALEEPWWVNLRAVSANILLFTVYTDSSNPDKKSVVAHDVDKNSMAWWRNGFSVTTVNRLFVRGIDSRFPEKETILDLFTGEPVQHAEFDLADSQNFPVIRPFQYEEGTTHFNTVKDFFSSRLGFLAVVAVEYLEYEDLIIVSVFVNESGLANYLYVLNASGECLIKEKLGENLKGVALDSFFIFSGHLIFVKNKNELTSYKII